MDPIRLEPIRCHSLVSVTWQAISAMRALARPPVKASGNPRITPHRKRGSGPATIVNSCDGVEWLRDRELQLTYLFAQPSVAPHESLAFSDELRDAAAAS